MYSRRQTLEEKKNKKKATWFFILSILMIGSMFYFGIPLIVRYAGFLSTIKRGSDPIETKDNTPPAPPRLDSLPKTTKDTSIDINGATEEGATITIVTNGNKEELIANSNGRFSHNVTLIDGINKISVSSKDRSGNESQKSEVEISFDNEPPKIELISPSDGQSYFGSGSKTIYVEGSTEKDSEVSINDKFAVVNSEGKFKKQITLSEGPNELTIKAIDEASNLTEIKITVNYTL